MENKLIIPIYLNQKIVFDFIAIIEDGISQIKNIKRTESSENKIDSNISGEIGTSNVFSLLSVKLKAGLSGSHKGEASNTSTEEKIHTPTSLFSKLLNYLTDNKIIKEINNCDDLTIISEGNFVQFKGKLEKNPIISSMKSIEKLMKLAISFMDEQPQQSNHKKGQHRKRNDPNQKIFEQINSLVNSLKDSNIMDIICKINKNEDIVAVLQTDIDYFYNKSINEIIDGQFYVIGKVIKINKNDAEELNLLRNTSLSMMNEKLIDQFSDTFKDNDISNAGIEIPEIRIKIKGDSLLVIPIAIYT